MSVEFDTVLVGMDDIREIAIWNSGTSELILSSIVPSDDIIVVTPQADTIDVGKQKSFEVRFLPDSIDVVDVIVLLHHNAPGSPDTITVHGSATKVVRPGDTNADDIVGVSDIVNIGLCYGEIGPVRAGIPDSLEQLLPIGWDQEICARADCDGDRTVSANDVIVIVENFGRELWTGIFPKKSHVQGSSGSSIVNQLIEATKKMPEGRARTEILAKLVYYKHEVLGIPREWSLLQNYPNPFNAETIIKYGVPEGANQVTVSIYDVLGRRIRVFEELDVEEGWHEFRWDGIGDQGTRMASGVFFYRLEVPLYSTVKKITYLK